MKAKYFAVAIVVAVLSSSAVWAVPLAGLFNTGVDSSGNAWVTAGVPDIHYNVIASPSGAFVPVTVDDTVYPFPPWVANNPASRWIGPAALNANGPSGFYTYRTTFNVPSNAILSTVMISGLWGTDDPGNDILINGASTFQTSAGFTSLVPFSINSGFVVGPNTLDFLLFNAGGPTGLRVDQIQGKYQQVPEPATVFSLLGGALLLLLRGRRRMT
jgi:hypothetical protein